MADYSIELIDSNENIDNFKFNKVSEDDLQKIRNSFKLATDGVFEFSCLEGEILLQSKFFRGLMYSVYIAPPQTVLEETRENSVEISRLDLKHNFDNQIEMLKTNLSKIKK